MPEPDRRAAAIFSVGAALVALHAVVDAFLAPEPGTAPGDHLTGGTASLALLALAVVVFPRLRAGGQAALAAVLGALALVGAGIAVEDARAVGPRGDDWTGFLLAPAGLTLIGLGAVLLWRSRKGGRLRWLRRAAIAACSIVAAYWIVVPVATAILATHRPRADVAPAQLGRPYREVTITTREGLELAGWYVPSRNGAAVISYPTRSGKLPQAAMLARHGYGVLLLDARGYDGSEGDPNLFGWEGTKDVDAAVGWLRRRPDVRDGRIGGIGFSVGGEVMLQAAAADVRLRAVVSEGAGIRSVREELLYGARGWPSLPAAAVRTSALAVLSGAPPPPSLEDVVRRIGPRPVFLIYAGHGAGGEELDEDYYRAAREPKLVWRIGEAHHVGGWQARPAEYERRVVGFFDRALLAGEA
ncbi:MAG TPA: CocE/NonD family hydrolase [Gaiellaceae bacterium]|jgi:fermentation-respiration switch protein FrsA (DUF1100 family)